MSYLFFIKEYILKKYFLLVLMILMSACGATPEKPSAKSTLSVVKERGFLRCGVNGFGLYGFSNKEAGGNWKGLDVDTCRAVAAAIFGDSEKVEFVPLSGQERFVSLQSRAVDILSRNTVGTLTRDAALGLRFVGVNYFDGLGTMVHKDLGVNSFLYELNNPSICLLNYASVESELKTYLEKNSITHKFLKFKDAEGAYAAFENNQCDVFVSDQLHLYAIKSEMRNPESAVVLPELITNEPMGPLVRQGDEEWFSIVRWVLYAMVEAEFLSINSENIKIIKDNGSRRQQLLLGDQDKFGEYLALDESWILNIISQVGNYGEVFRKNLTDTDLNIPRQQNDLWVNGGLIYSQPLR